MKVGSFSPQLLQNLNSSESQSPVTPQTKGPAELNLTVLPRDGFEFKGGFRPKLRPQGGDGFESPKTINLQHLPGKTSLGELTNLFKAGKLRAPEPLPSELEPLKGALDSITQSAIENTELDNLGKIRQNVSSALKDLGLKGWMLAKAVKELSYAIIGGKAGGIGPQWFPGD
jgi:hypothetical protein